MYEYFDNIWKILPQSWNISATLGRVFFHVCCHVGTKVLASAARKVYFRTLKLNNFWFCVAAKCIINIVEVKNKKNNNTLVGHSIRRDSWAFCRFGLRFYRKNGIVLKIKACFEKIQDIIFMAKSWI